MTFRLVLLAVALCALALFTAAQLAPLSVCAGLSACALLLDLAD